MRARCGSLALLLAAAARAQEPTATPASPPPSPSTSPPTSTPAPPPTAAARKAHQAEEAGKAGDWRAALFSWQEAANLDPRNAGYRMQLGEAYEKLSFFDEAARQYETAAALAPPGDEARRRAARARALRDGKEVPPEPSGPSATTPAAGPYEAGVALIARGQYAAAVERLDEAVRLDPRLAVAYSARASALFGLGRFLDSAADYRTALSLDPSRATPLFGLGECNRLLGQGVAAVDYYARYLQSRAPDVRDDLRAEARKRLEDLRH